MLTYTIEISDLPEPPPAVGVLNRTAVLRWDCILPEEPTIFRDEKVVIEIAPVLFKTRGMDLQCGAIRYDQLHPDLPGCTLGTCTGCSDHSIHFPYRFRAKID